MNPIAIVPILIEGLVYFRRALSLYASFSSIKGKFEGMASLFEKQIRSTSALVGEEVYLFLLFRQTLKVVFPRDRFTSDDYNALALVAIGRFHESRSSFDPRGTIIEFAYVAGQVAQEASDTFIDRAKASLNDAAQNAKLGDPVLNYLIAVGEQTGLEDQNIYTQLGIPPNVWNMLTEGPIKASFGMEWVETALNYPTEGFKPHKSQTFLGLLIRGAETLKDTDVDTIPISGGNDGLQLSLLSLIRPTPLFPTKSRLPDDRSITVHMVTSMANKITASRGLVKVINDEWHPITDTMLVDGSVYDPKLKGKLVRVLKGAEATDPKIKPKTEIVSSGIQSLAKQAESKALSSGVDLLIKALSSRLKVK